MAGYTCAARAIYVSDAGSIVEYCVINMDGTNTRWTSGGTICGGVGSKLATIDTADKQAFIWMNKNWLM
jgi:hypothetical protein